MQTFKVIAKKLDGTIIEETVEAPDAETAKLILMKYRDLKRLGRQVYAVNDVSEVAPFKPVKPQEKRTGVLSEEKNLEIAESLRNNDDVSRADYSSFKEEFKLIVRAAIKDLWQGVYDVTREELEEDMYKLIYSLFIPRFNPERGPLFPFIKLQVRRHITKKWNRKLKKSGDNKKTAKSREKIMQDHDYLEQTKLLPQTEMTEEEDRAFCYRMCAGLKQQQIEGTPIKLLTRTDLFRKMAKLDLHHELLRGKKNQRREYQIWIFEQIYKLMKKESEVATFGKKRSQSSIHEAKIRAEQSIIEAAAKLFLSK